MSKNKHETIVIDAGKDQRERFKSLGAYGVQFLPQLWQEAGGRHITTKYPEGYQI